MVPIGMFFFGWHGNSSKKNEACVDYVTMSQCDYSYASLSLSKYLHTICMYPLSNPQFRNQLQGLSGGSSHIMHKIHTNKYVCIVYTYISTDTYNKYYIYIHTCIQELIFKCLVAGMHPFPNSSTMLHSDVTAALRSEVPQCVQAAWLKGVFGCCF